CVETTEVWRVQSITIGIVTERLSARFMPMLSAGFMLSVLAAAPVAAAPQDKPAALDKAASPEHLFGAYLAGRDAQQRRDFSAASKWFDKALALDPDAPEVISRDFLMDVSVGRFDRALTLASRELKLDPSDAIAQMVLLIDKLKNGDNAGALKYAAALPSDGVHRFVGP